MSQNLALKPHELERLTAIWAEHLPESADISTGDFFESGGDSLGATMLLIELKVEFRVEVPLEAFLDSPNLASLEKLMAELRVKSTAGDASM